MKTVAIIVSFLVVILLNANIFKIYRNLAEGDVQRAAIVQSGEVLLERLQKQENKTAPTTTPTATPTPAANQSEDQVKEIKANVQELQQYVGDYKGLGFTPLTPKKVWNYASGQKEWQGIGAGVRFAYGLEVLLGWTIMALLLSVGAPFWQDVLESLFGIKGLIRQKNKTRNVEEEAGGGQTKP
jgi:hypothetical protein